MVGSCDRGACMVTPLTSAITSRTLPYLPRSLSTDFDGDVLRTTLIPTVCAARVEAARSTTSAAPRIRGVKRIWGNSWGKLLSIEGSLWSRKLPRFYGDLSGTPYKRERLGRR